MAARNGAVAAAGQVGYDWRLWAEGAGERQSARFGREDRDARGRRWASRGSGPARPPRQGWRLGRRAGRPAVEGRRDGGRRPPRPYRRGPAPGPRLPDRPGERRPDRRGRRRLHPRHGPKRRPGKERGALYAAMSAVDLDAILAATGRRGRRADRRGGSGLLDAVGRLRPAGRRRRRRGGCSGSAARTRRCSWMWPGRSSPTPSSTSAATSRSRPGALSAAGLVRGWFDAEIARRRASGDLGADLMGALLSQARLDDDGVRRTLSGMLVGAIDTTATATSKILVVLVARQGARAAARGRGRSGAADRLVPRGAAALAAQSGAAAQGGARHDARPAARARPAPTYFSGRRRRCATPRPFPIPPRWTRTGRRGTISTSAAACIPAPGAMVNDMPDSDAGRQDAARGLQRVGPVRWAGPFPDRPDVG